MTRLTDQLASVVAEMAASGRTADIRAAPAGRGPAPAAAAGPGHPAAGAAGPARRPTRELRRQQVSELRAERDAAARHRRPAGSAPRRPRSPGPRRRRRSPAVAPVGRRRPRPRRPAAGAAARHARGRGGGAAPGVGSDRRRPGPRRRGRRRTAGRIADAERTTDPARLLAWLGLPRAHLIVDGYNVTKTGYPELSLADQRDRLIRGLAALSARTSAELTVVFDGAAVATARPAGRGIRVLFSPPGVLADDVIRDLVRSRADRPGRRGGQLGSRGGGRRRRATAPAPLRRRRSSACSAGDPRAAPSRSLIAAVERPCRCPSVASAVRSGVARIAAGAHDRRAPAPPIGPRLAGPIRRRDRSRARRLRSLCRARRRMQRMRRHRAARARRRTEWSGTRRERAALGALADSGLVPPLRLVPSLPLRRREAG